MATSSADNQGSAAGRLFAGIDAGSVSVNGIVIDPQQRIVHESAYRRHFGKVEEAAAAVLGDFRSRFGADRIAGLAFTGSHGRRLSERFEAPYEVETICQVVGVVHLRPGVRSVISMGGQDTALLQISYSEAGWELDFFNTNGPCASGTGSFIDQQAERLATAIYARRGNGGRPPIDGILADFIALGMASRRPANVACRCTVFTKSDMIHLQNKGERLEDIIHGLHVGNARNCISTLVSNRALEAPLLFIGGLSLNRLQVQALRAYYPELAVPPHSTSVGALGAALLGQAAGAGRATPRRPPAAGGGPPEAAVPVGPKLVLRRTAFPEANDAPRPGSGPRVCGTLGIDIGSTSTKYALVDDRGRIRHKRYIATQGKPVEAVQSLLAHLRAEFGARLEIRGVATTGSGRNVAADFLQADLVIDEITAHARGAVAIDPEVDTIFEIGGQDSKYIAVRNTHPLDFDMNKVCAAGTGSFLHELANKHGIDIVGEFQEVAMSSEAPVKLAERCTVFMESDLMSYHQRGVDRRDLIAGLCYAIVHNYLNRVVGKRRVGERVMFLGGPSLNKAVVAAFENVLGRALLVPPHREVLGAFGAAVCLQERLWGEPVRMSRFRGIESAVADRMGFTEAVCRADSRCHNRCKLKIYDFDGRKSVWGGECGRYESARIEAAPREDFFAVRQAIWEEHTAGVCATLAESPLMEADGRPTVGMPRAFYGLQAGVLWAHFFDRLGFRLALTPATDEETSKKGIESVLAETCYPVKVAHGHARRLIGKTRHLFIPIPVDMATPRPGERGYYCPMVQSSAFMIRAALGIDASSVLSPSLRFKSDPDLLAVDLHGQIGGRLGVGRSRVREALRHALRRQKEFLAALHRRGREALAAHPVGEPLVVVTGRPYNLHDPRMNLRLGQSLAKIGVAALPMDVIDAAEMDLAEFSSMYWGVGAQILRTAKWIRATPYGFGLHLTNFGCGADSFIEHFYKHTLGDKPCLILELDEHSAAAGVMTRLEAFRHVIRNGLRPERRRGAPMEARPGRSKRATGARRPEAAAAACRCGSGS